MNYLDSIPFSFLNIIITIKSTTFDLYAFKCVSSRHDICAHLYIFIRSIVCLSFLRNLNATLKEEKAITDQPVVN